jgi:hypothetical protein
MKSWALKAMNEPFDNNQVIKMWVIININTLLTKWLNEFLKLAKIVVVSIFGSMENEHIFSMFVFMKNKLHNRLGPNLNIIF